MSHDYVGKTEKLIIEKNEYSFDATIISWMLLYYIEYNMIWYDLDMKLDNIHKITFWWH